MFERMHFKSTDNRKLKAQAAEPTVSFRERQEQLAQQFRDLDRNDPSSWPAAPKWLLYAFVCLGIFAFLWFLLISGVLENLEQETQKELQLRKTYQDKLSKALVIDVLKDQKRQITLQVTQLEQQLPSKAEMDALLDNINEAGRSANLESEIFKPNSWVLNEYYAELPITLKYKGKFHEIGAFASNLASLHRIVSLNNLSIVSLKDGVQTFEATAKTFRYLDSSEIEAQRKAKQDKAKTLPAS